MLVLYSFLASLLWGSLIGGSLRRGHAIDKIHLRRAHLVIGSIIFTVPAVVTLMNSPVTGRGLIIAAIAAVVALTIGIRVGITTYWID